MTAIQPLGRQRRAGVLLHLSSLPSRPGIDRVRQWLDFMDAAALSVWQFLPLGPTHWDGSPYQTQSAFAVDPALFPEIGERLRQRPHGEAFSRFCARQADWLEDYALYAVLKQLYDGRPWFEWLAAHRDRDAAALQQLRHEHDDTLRGIMWQQFCCHEHWQEIRQQAGALGISLFGDLPIFVAHDSADVWAHRELFLLDEDGQPRLVTGVPPDYFSATGQRWGNPHYDWDALRHSGFSWWLGRIRYLLEWVDIFRIDHFRGLEAVWMIPVSAATAAEGYWEKTPGDRLLADIRHVLGEVPMVAEDLGVITPEVVALRQRNGLPGMAVLQFAFDAFTDNPHKPANVGSDTVIYTGTHDNDTVAGWFAALDAEQQRHVRSVLGIGAEDDPVWTMISTAFATPACLAIVPMQDYLGLGSAARMNMPGTVDGNWQWRLDPGALTPEVSGRIRNLVVTHDRKY